MPRVPFGLALLAVGLMYLLGLGAAPFLDPPEGFHAAIAQTVRDAGDWITLRMDGVRYFDKPPLLYWLMAASFARGRPHRGGRARVAGAGRGRLAAVTGRIGMILGGPRVGLLAGLFTAANLGIFVFGRQVKPDLPFILFIVLAYAGFIVAYRGGGRWGLVLFYGSLGLADAHQGRARRGGRRSSSSRCSCGSRASGRTASWAPWWGVAILLGVALPWYLAVELRNDGFLWYTVVDNHLLNFTRQRVFPDEDVPLGALQFLASPCWRSCRGRWPLPWALRARAAAAVGRRRRPAVGAAGAVGRRRRSASSRSRRSSCRTTGCPRSRRSPCWPRGRGTTASRRCRARRRRAR